VGLSNFMESEVGLAVGLTAAAFSPRVRDHVRKGAVYGLAGALKAGDLVVSGARGAARGAQNVATDARDTTTPARRPASSRAARGTTRRRSTNAKPAAKPAASAS